MRNYQTSKRILVRKSTKTDDILAIFFQNINAVLEKVHNVQDYLHYLKYDH